MRFSLIFLTLLSTAAVRAQLIAATILAFQVTFDIVSTVAEEGILAEITSSAEIELTEVAAEEIELNAIPQSSVTTINGQVGEETIVGVESAKFFHLTKKAVNAVMDTKFVTSDFLWEGFQISQAGGKRIWVPKVTGTVKNGFKLDKATNTWITDGGGAIFKRGGDAGAYINYGEYVPTGGYRIAIKEMFLNARLATQ
ncbi:uncharacterized protein IWZ02DRAFT_437687 [Phyllosticta citriasiana]|uniref:uncharacterized protein n=1 Tax=Phyllosticta citriasiana TaxID=595635 RepID=UPI0030FDED71